MATRGATRPVKEVLSSFCERAAGAREAWMAAMAREPLCERICVASAVLKWSWKRVGKVDEVSDKVV